MTKSKRPPCRLPIMSLLFGMALAATSALAAPQIKVYPIAAGSAATVTPAEQLQSANQPLIVGVEVAPPFVVEDHGHYHGLAIDLWQETAAEHGWNYVYQAYELESLLDAVSDSKVDVGIGAITATAAREQRMDFTHPILSSGLGVAVRGEQVAGWLAVTRALASPAFLKIVATLALLLLMVGLLVWLFEHKSNPEQFGGSSSQGIFSGCWWALVTLTTVGYGGTAPRTVGGRIIGLLWMLAALVVVSFFIASITSALTVGQLSDRVRRGADLGGMQLASIPASTGAAWLERQRLAYDDARDIDAALADLAAGRVDAVVYDAPLMHWSVQQHFRGKLKVLPLLLERQDHAFALPTDSRLREPINISLLQRINAPDWPGRLEKAFSESVP